MKQSKRYLLLVGFLFYALSCSPKEPNLGHAPRMGKAGALIEVIVFSDFQCVFCRRAAAELRRIYTTKPNRVKVFFKHFPLSGHPAAFNAARAAEAARLQGKFWEMHDILFERQGALHDGIWVTLAEEIGLDLERFKTDIWSAATLERVTSDKAEGVALGVKGTPYFLVNRMPFRYSYADLAKRLRGLDGFK